MIKGNHVSWDTVSTDDFLPTVMEVLGVSRPADQADWHVDGQSVMPLVKGGPGALPIIGRGWMFENSAQRGFRLGPWKLVEGSKSCSNADCQKPLLFNLEEDLAEANDVSAQYPSILASMQGNLTAWFDSVNESRVKESGCPAGPLPPPSDV